MATRVNLGTRIKENVKDRLFAAADKEGRSASNLTEYIIKKWLDENHPEKDQNPPKAVTIPNESEKPKEC